MSNRERALQLFDRLPDSKIMYLIGYMQGLTAEEYDTPNEETLVAMAELENGGGECFDSVDDLWREVPEGVSQSL